MGWKRHKLIPIIIRVLSVLFVVFGYYSCGESTSEKIDAYIKYCYDNHLFSGSALVAKNGEVIYHESLGIANFNPHQPIANKIHSSDLLLFQNLSQQWRL